MVESHVERAWNWHHRKVAWPRQVEARWNSWTIRRSFISLQQSIQAWYMYLHPFLTKP